jgi:hypothetical protein
VSHISSLADFDYFFLFGAWFQLIGALASAAAGAERFNGEQDNPGDSTDFNIPLVAVKPELNSVADYFGLPLGKTMNVSALPFRSHNLIFNDWFRDENLQQHYYQGHDKESHHENLGHEGVHCDL